MLNVTLAKVKIFAVCMDFGVQCELGCNVTAAASFASSGKHGLPPSRSFSRPLSAAVPYSLAGTID